MTLCSQGSIEFIILYTPFASLGLLNELPVLEPEPIGNLVRVELLLGNISD